MDIVIGGSLVVSGLLIAYGAVTGRLAQMLGAIVGIGKGANGYSPKPTYTNTVLGNLPVVGPIIQGGPTNTEKQYLKTVVNNLPGIGPVATGLGY